MNPPTIAIADNGAPIFIFIIVAVVVVIGGALWWWRNSPRWTVARRRRRGECETCGYRLSGSMLVCPRCGAPTAAPPDAR
jgi:hypothetical protein